MSAGDTPMLLKFTVGGLGAVAAGIWMTANPRLFTGGARPTLDDYAPGIGALAVGLIFLAFVGWAVFRRPR